MTGKHELTQEYDQHGIQFRYPAGWTLEEQSGEDEISVSLQSPETAFWMLTLYFEKPNSELLIESAIDAYKEEYTEVDVFESEMRVGEHLGAAADIEFACLDLMNTALIRTFVTDRFTAVILAQISGSDSEETLGLIDQITRTVLCEEDRFGFQEEIRLEE